MTSLVGSGTKDLELLGLRLTVAGNGGLRRELLAGLRAGARPLIPALQDAARAELPKRGGLNEHVAASRFSVRTRLGPGSAGVSIVNQPAADTSRRGGGQTQFGSDRGAVRHPVFGHKDRWAVTTVQPGWFSKTLEARMPQVAAELTATVTAVADRLAGRAL